MRKALCVFTILFLMLPSLVLADSPVPQPKYLAIQGAKVVSEGAYFYFNITSKNNDSPHDLQVRIWKNSEFVWIDYEEYFWLKNNESRIFHLIAPNVEDWYEDFTITITCMVGGFRTDAPAETVYFRIIVVDYVALHNNLYGSYGGQTYAELQKKNARLNEQIGYFMGYLGQLEKQLKRLENQLEEQLPIEVLPKGYVPNYVVILLIGITAISVALLYEINNRVMRTRTTKGASR